jgi:hypothetical protein
VPQLQGLGVVFLRRRRRGAGTGMVDSDWSALMAAAQSGNAAVYHRLLGEVGEWLRRYYARRLPPAMVDDAVQDRHCQLNRWQNKFAQFPLANGLADATFHPIWIC